MNIEQSLKHIKIKMLLTLFVLLFSTSGFAEIKDKRIFNNFYNSCMEERPSDITLNEMKKYCSCAGNNVMRDFTIQEILLIERDISLANSEEEEIKIAMANEKIFNIFSSCIEEIFQ